MRNLYWSMEWNDIYESQYVFIFGIGINGQKDD